MVNKQLSIPSQLLLPAKVIHINNNDPKTVICGMRAVIIIDDPTDNAFLKINEIVIPLGQTIININGRDGYAIGSGYLAILYEHLLNLLMELSVEVSKNDLINLGEEEEC